MSWYDATRKTYFWDYKKPFTYEIKGNISIETPILQDKKVLEIIDISSTTMNAIFRIVKRFFILCIEYFCIFANRLFWRRSSFR